MEFDKNGILNRAKEAQQSATVMDEGLRAYMLKVYNYMGAGVLLTGIFAVITFKISAVTNDSGMLVGLTSFGNTIYNSGFKWLVVLAPIVPFFMFMTGMRKMSSSKAKSICSNASSSVFCSPHVIVPRQIVLTLISVLPKFL